jgi:hypothetical protein
MPMTPKKREELKLARENYEKTKYYKIKTKKGNPTKKDEMKEE